MLEQDDSESKKSDHVFDDRVFHEWTRGPSCLMAIDVGSLKMIRCGQHETESAPV
jgi:hypothetical protein